MSCFVPILNPPFSSGAASSGLIIREKISQLLFHKALCLQPPAGFGHTHFIHVYSFVQFKTGYFSKVVPLVAHPGLAVLFDPKYVTLHNSLFSRDAAMICGIYHSSVSCLCSDETHFPDITFKKKIYPMVQSVCNRFARYSYSRL